MDAFWTRGYGATSMQDIIDITGANRATLYSTFGDKRAVFMAALRHYEAWMRGMLFESVSEGASPIEVIRQFLMAFVNAEGARGCFVTNTALEVAPHDEEIRSFVASVQHDVERRLAELIEIGKTAGLTPEYVEAEPESKSILATVIGLSVLARTRPNKTYLKSIVDQTLRRIEM